MTTNKDIIKLKDVSIKCGIKLAALHQRCIALGVERFKIHKKYRRGSQPLYISMSDYNKIVHYLDDDKIDGIKLLVLAKELGKARQSVNLWCVDMDIKQEQHRGVAYISHKDADRVREYSKRPKEKKEFITGSQNRDVNNNRDKGHYMTIQSYEMLNSFQGGR